MSNEAPPPSYYTANQGTGPRDRPNDNSLEGEEPLPLDDEGRRSMEDEERPLPEGWVRQLDPNTGHHFYVDTKANPPKSIWQHPYDDPSVWQHPGDSGARQGQQQQQQRPAAAERTNTSEKQSLGIRIKDKLTGTTHEEREEGRRQRYRQQLAAEKAYMERRKQMIAAMRQQQLNNPQMMYGSRYGYGGGMYGAPAYGYSPMYRRRGGMGMPLAAGMGGGLLGGMMLGGAMDGGFGGGDFGGGDCGGGDGGGGGE